MTTITTAPTGATTLLSRHVRAVRVGARLWRITAPDGSVFGHVERIPTPQGDRFEAKRYRVASSSFLSAGSFWSFGDAVECLRLG